MSTNVGAHTGFYPQNASYKPSTPEDIATHVHILYIYMEVQIYSIDK